MPAAAVRPQYEAAIMLIIYDTAVLVYGVASLPFNAPVELDVIFEVA